MIFLLAGISISAQEVASIPVADLHPLPMAVYGLTSKLRNSLGSIRIVGPIVNVAVNLVQALTIPLLQIVCTILRSTFDSLGLGWLADILTLIINGVGGLTTALEEPFSGIANLVDGLLGSV